MNVLFCPLFNWIKSSECKGPHDVTETRDYVFDVQSLVLDMHITDVTLGVYK